MKSNKITRLILNKIFRLKKKSFLRDISCIWRFSWFPLFARFVIIFRLRDEKNSTRLPFNGNGIEHLTIAIIAFNVFSHSASLRVLHKKIPLQLKNDSHYVNESADDIDYFGKCITGVSHVCPAPQAYLSLQGRVASFESQLLSVMELRTVVICGTRSWHDGEVANSRTYVTEGWRTSRKSKYYVYRGHSEKSCAKRGAKRVNAHIEDKRLSLEKYMDDANIV